MVKYCLDKYPMGSFVGQQTPGRFMDGFLYKNLELLASKITKDMTFLGIIYSSTLEVGTGKSVLATQIGEAWTEIVNKQLKLEIPYTLNNIVWRPKDLIERSFKVPKYSYILLDEWEDSTYWSELGITLRQFFRKCRQLNLFIMCIIPNWFQLPLNYAVSRSIFAIDVRFNDKLDRGFFAFYNFPDKRMLYINGKKNHNYKCARPTFLGRFPDGYGVDEKEYRKKKYDDMIEYDKKNPIKESRIQIETRVKVKILTNFLKKFPKAPTCDLANFFSVSEVTINRWKRGDVEVKEELPNNYNNELYDNKEIIVDEEGLAKEENKLSDFNYEQ